MLHHPTFIETQMGNGTMHLERSASVCMRYAIPSVACPYDSAASAQHWHSSALLIRVDLADQRWNSEQTVHLAYIPAHSWSLSHITPSHPKFNNEVWVLYYDKFDHRIRKYFV